MSRDVRLYIDDILASSNKAINYTTGMSFEEFETREQVYDAVLHNLFVIGEAANHISEDFRERYPDVPWRKMIGLRNIIAHAYHGSTVTCSGIW